MERKNGMAELVSVLTQRAQSECAHRKGRVSARLGRAGGMRRAQ
jgi:hypothetical protein